MQSGRGHEISIGMYYANMLRHDSMASYDVLGKEKEKKAKADADADAAWKIDAWGA